MPEAENSQHSINDVLVEASARLKNCSDSPALDAQVLLAHVLVKNRSWLIAHAKEMVPVDQLEAFNRLLAQRTGGTPVAYLTGEQEFWSLALMVTPDTLIPRPETELLVELALEKLPGGKACRVADIGTGSGATALAIASERKNCQLLATDISAVALAVARANAHQLKIDNVDFVEGADLQPLGSEIFDLIVSNPPYIPEDDPHLSQGDVRFEPRSALVAGEDGLDRIRVLIAESIDHLNEGGWLMLEHGYDQEQVIARLFAGNRYRNIECYRDLAGQPRVTIGQR